MKRLVDWDWMAANASLQRALALDPGNPAVLYDASTLAGSLGHFEEALELVRRSITLDPLNAASRESLAQACWAIERLQDYRFIFRFNRLVHLFHSSFRSWFPRFATSFDPCRRDGRFFKICRSHFSNRRAAGLAPMCPSAEVAALSTFGKSKATDTAIDEGAFRVTLLGQWSRKPTSDTTRWVYQSDNGKDQLTVSLLGFKSGISADERSKTFKRLAESRKHAESATPDLTAVTTTDTTFSESGGILAARYGGN
jgi:tetratricopeptide (TPR) repeat protein